MFKSLVLSCFMLLMFGCGLVGTYTAYISTEVPAETDIRGISTTTYMNSIDVSVVKNTMPGLKISDLTYEISRNDGGAGVIEVTVMDLGQACDMTVPLVSIEIIKGETVSKRPLPAASLIDKLNERLSSGGKMCLHIVQQDVGLDVTPDPINIHLKITAMIGSLVSNISK